MGWQFLLERYPCMNSGGKPPKTLLPLAFSFAPGLFLMQIHRASLDFLDRTSYVLVR